MRAFYSLAPHSPSSEPVWLEAITSGDVAALRRFVCPENVNDLTVGGSTALHLASEGTDTEVVKILLAAGADAGALDEDGWACTHNAALKATPDVMLLLLNAGAPVDIINSSGRTPLSLALWTSQPTPRRHPSHHQMCARLLLDRGAQLGRARGLIKQQWVQGFSSARSACARAALLFVGICTLQRSPYASTIGKDVGRLLGVCIWRTRILPAWTG